jgi:hypothetical protein
VGSQEIEQEPLALGEVAAAALEQEDLRVRRRCGQADVELELDAEQPEELPIDLASAQLPAGEEVGDLERREVLGEVLVHANRVLMPKPPERAHSVFPHAGVDFARATAAVIEEHTLVRPVELAVVDVVAAYEVTKQIEKRGRERVVTGHALGLAKEVQRLP